MVRFESRFFQTKQTDYSQKINIVSAVFLNLCSEPGRCHVFLTSKSYWIKQPEKEFLSGHDNLDIYEFIFILKSGGFRGSEINPEKRTSGHFIFWKASNVNFFPVS
ncbi:MAG: hypothetical protein DRI57_13100 [Deltaproteobacteria bacterium]|nr:MAG: hypothetical protein DRI57_13100 [Deltaproteobacteria bacterium]